MKNKTLALASLVCLPLVASADQVPDALARYYRENTGRVLRRLPTWIVPENAFLSISNLDFDETTRGVTDRILADYAAKGDYNCVTYTLRCVPDLSDPRVEARVARTARALHASGIQMLMDVDPRIFRNEFLARWPGDALRMRQLALVGDEATTNGATAFRLVQSFMRDHMCYGTEPYSGYRPGRLVGTWAVAGGDVATRRPVVAECVTTATNAVAGVVRGLAAGEKLLVEVEFELKEADPTSPHLIPFTREMTLRYRRLGADAVMRDEWGYCTPRAEMKAHRAFWYSEPFAAAYRRRSGGRDLAADLPLMAFGPASQSRYDAIAAYMRVIYDRCKETEVDFYNSNKEYFGPEAYITKHPTWSTMPHIGELAHNGLSWWAARRDWAQGDESSRVPALNGMAKKFGGPVWLNEGYGGPSELHYPRTLWRYVLAGGRMVYHGITDRPAGDDPVARRYASQADLMKPACLRAEEASRLLPLVSRAQIDCPTAHVFGHARLANWADAGFEDWGEGLFNALGFCGHYVDAYPASELEGPTFTVDAEGRLRVGQQAYAACILYHLSSGERANWERLVTSRPLKTRVFVDPEPETVIAYLDAIGATKQTPFDETGFRGRRQLSNKLPLADGVLRLLDGTVARVKGGRPDPAGDLIEGVLDVDGVPVAYAARGLFAARVDAKGQLQALAAADLRRVSLPGFELRLDAPEDVALVRLGGVWHGTWQTGDTLADVPAPLAALTPNWVKLHAAGLAASRGENHVDAVVSRILVEVAKLKAADPDAVPMAFWDFDGTIIKGDVSEGYAKDGVVGFRGLLEETIRAGLCTAYRGEEGWRAFRRDYPTLRRLGRWLAWPSLGQMYHGTKAADIDAFCRARFRDVYAKWYYASSVEILRRLEAAGVENHVISASPELFVRNGGASLGLEATRMNGLRVGIDGGYVSTRIEEPVAMGEGKVEVLRRVVNARPHARAVAGFGDSYFTDGPFLRYVATQRLPGGAKGFAMMINGKEKNPEYDGLFLCVSQQKTVADAARR